jgi:quinol monooxygenase YgiN
MTEIQGIGRLKIRDGKLEAFKRVVAHFMRVVRERDTGTLQYEVYLNTDRGECLVLERYRDLQALLEHHVHVRGLMDELLETCTMSSEVCATSTPELIEALGASGIAIYEQLA